MKITKEIVYQGSKYGCYEFRDQYLPAKNLKVGAKVVCMVSRLSSSNWQEKTNVNHGWVAIDGIVTDIESNGKRCVTLDASQIENWEKPIGKEKSYQSLGCIGYPVDHIVKYKGY